MARHSAARPPWWHHLVPQRWRPQDTRPMDRTGPASAYAGTAAQARLRDPAWADHHHDDAITDWDNSATLVVPAMSPLLTEGQAARAANTGPHRAA